MKLQGNSTDGYNSVGAYVLKTLLSWMDYFHSNTQG